MTSIGTSATGRSRSFNQLAANCLFNHTERVLACVETRFSLRWLLGLGFCHAETITENTQRKKSNFKLTHYQKLCVLETLWYFFCAYETAFDFWFGHGIACA